MYVLWKSDDGDVGYITCLTDCKELLRITNQQKKGLCVRY